MPTLVKTFKNETMPYKCPYCEGVIKINDSRNDKWYHCKKCKRAFNPKMVKDPTYEWYIIDDILESIKKNWDE